MVKDITVITVTWNSAPLLPGLVEVLRELAPYCELLISDNASTDGTPGIIRGYLPEAVVLDNPVNGGFGYGNNRALEHCSTPYVLLLNADASIGPPDLAALVKALDDNPGFAAVQPLVRLWGWPMVTLSAGTALTRFGEGYDLDFMRFQPAPDIGILDVPGVTAAVSLWRREALDSVGGFDERFFMYFEDIDLCLRLHSKGLGFGLAGSASARHMSGTSSTRVEALEWELISSILIARRFLAPEGRALPHGWKPRERRIRLSRMLRGEGSGWRRRAMARAMATETGRVDLPTGALDRFTEERPGRMPVPRPPVPAGSLDSEGSLVAGPGWLPSGRIAECGFGCIGVPGTGGRVEFRLRICGEETGSVALWSEDCLRDRVLPSPGADFHLSCEIPGDGSHFYIVPDRSGIGIELINAKLIRKH